MNKLLKHKKIISNNKSLEISKSIAYQCVKVDSGVIESSSINLPKIYGEAISRPYTQSWQEAVAEVKQALQESETGSAMHLPKRKRVISSQWVFAIKKQFHNHSTKYTRLVINGFSHPERIDYFKAFAQESIATEEDLEIVKFNVKTAFVY